MTPIKSLPSEARPRERLARFGADALSEIELLAILFGSGTKNRSVLSLAAAILAHFGSLRRVAEASLEELREVKGVGVAKAILIKAAFALAQRQEEEVRPLLDTPEKAYALIRSEIQRQEIEVLMVILRDVKRQLVHREILSKGILNELLVHPREVFHSAIKHRAHSLIIAHNHPSGDPHPSRRDCEMTQILIAAGRVIGIPLADHLIVGSSGYISFFQSGLMLSRSLPY